MAVADEVEVVLRADVNRYIADITRAESTFSAKIADMQSEAERAGAAFSRIGQGANNGFAGIARDAPRAATAIRGANIQTGNLAAQLNDIGVSLASGQSPFIVAIQQGAQIQQVLGPLGAGGAVSALGAAFASLVSPVSLATLAIVTAGSVAVSYFLNLLSSSSEAEISLDKQAQLIRSVADKWGDAVPALREYADEIQRLKDISDLATATQFQINAEFAKARDLLPEVRTEVGGVIEELIRAGASGRDVQLLRDSFNQLDVAAQDLQEGLAAGRDTTEEFSRFSAALASILGNEAVQGSNALTDAIYGLRDAYLAAIEAGNQLASQAAAAAAARPGTAERINQGQLTPDAFNARFGQRYNRSNEELFPDLFRNRPGSRGGGGGRGGGGVSEIQREAEATAKFIDQLEHELEILGLSNEERAVANNLRRLAASATEEQRAQVEELTRNLIQQRDAQKQANEAAQELANIGKEAFSGFIQDIRNGVSAADAFRNAINRALDSLLQLGINSLFSGGGLGSFFGIPKLASGTRSFPGGLARINEVGGEIVNLPNGSQVIPHDLSKRMVQQSSQSSSIINMPIRIDATGADAYTLARTNEALADLKRSIPAQIDARNRTRQTRGTRPGT